ncbi:gas vesicle structural protein GvpA [Streptomyces sp. NPDC000983]|uniref:gas vesicle structural protein GvpA n=1 Tax=Streptomyces sp. NPDC000983 TaxID=3154373 RepID=UPI00332586D1
MTVVPQGGGGVSRGSTSSLYDVLDLILDRGLVIDVFIRVSLVGIEILKIDIRIVVASVDTYLRFAEACNRLDLESGNKQPSQLTDIVGEITESGAEGKTSGVLSGAAKSVKNALTGGDDEEEATDEEEGTGAAEGEEEPEEEPRQRRRRPATRASRRQRE